MPKPLSKDDCDGIAAIEGWNIKLPSQPPQSPDLNKTNLGLFRSLQALTWYDDYNDLLEHHRLEHQTAASAPKVSGPEQK